MEEENKTLQASPIKVKTEALCEAKLRTADVGCELHASRQVLCNGAVEAACQ